MFKRLELQRITSQSEQVMGCLVRLYLFPESSQVPTWTIGVYEFLNSTHRVGFLRRFPNPDLIYRHGFSENYHVIKPMIDTYIKVQRDEYYQEELREGDFLYREPVGMISRYFFKVSEKLASDGAVTLGDVERWLTLIGFLRNS